VDFLSCVWVSLVTAACLCVTGRECCHPLREQWRANTCRCLSGVTLCVSSGEHTRGGGVYRGLPACVLRPPLSVAAGAL
jgi:hypothetical protein